MRLALKTLTYATMHLTVAVAVAYALTRDWRVALAVGLVEPMVQTLGFNIHERLWSRAAQGMAQLGLDVAGADALTGRESEWLSDYFTTRPTSVYGGSSQIQKNILARMLDMPRE